MAPEERAVHLVRALGHGRDAIDPASAERALCALGALALPALTGLLERGPDRWRAAKILADAGLATDEAIAAPARALRRTKGSDRDWTAAALSRPGRPDLVTAEPGLPDETVVGAVVAPYGSFRDRAVSPPPLDHEPLERLLAARPDLNEAVAAALGPGRALSGLRPHEAATAVEALRSSVPVVRRHAAAVLGNRALGTAVGQRVLPALAASVTEDPDPVTRRLALASLGHWKHDARDHQAAVRAAPRDPDPQVRLTARRHPDRRDH